MNVHMIMYARLLVEIEGGNNHSKRGKGVFLVADNQPKTFLKKKNARGRHLKIIRSIDFIL
jgi:hypothetical protein